MHPATRVAFVLVRGAVALALCVALFVLLPAAHRLLEPGERQEVLRQRQRAVVLQRSPEEPPKKSAPPRPLRNIASESGPGQSRRLSLTFTPDLGVGGGSGVAVAQQNLENVVFEEGQVEQGPVLLERTPVPYPPRAREAGIEGTVEMILEIDRTGAVARITFVSLPHTMLRRPVEGAVMNWRFSPARHQGVAVSIRVRQSVEFRLEGN